MRKYQKKKHFKEKIKVYCSYTEYHLRVKLSKPPSKGLKFHTFTLIVCLRIREDKDKEGKGQENE